MFIIKCVGVTFSQLVGFWVNVSKRSLTSMLELEQKLHSKYNEVSGKV